MSSYSFAPARRENVGVLLALAGSSGSGKTWSAMEIATGLAGGRRFAVIDTEARRALHYADRFAFDHCELRPPFRPQAYLEAVRAAEAAGYPVIVIDSMSHEHEGEGGLQEWAEAQERAGIKSPGNWAEPKAAHKRMMNGFLQCRAHLIFCLRAQEKISIERVQDDRTGRTKTVVVPVGWQPICEKRFMYEMTASFLLEPEAPGIGKPIKLQDQHRPMFPESERLGRLAGDRLRAWASGDAEAARCEPLAEPAGGAPGAGLAAMIDDLARCMTATDVDGVLDGFRAASAGWSAADKAAARAAVLAARERVTGTRVDA